jgi:isocitrate/isopropylmalate dehydrogenase
MLLAGCMMLEHIGQRGPAKRARDAISDTLSTGAARTPDLGGDATTESFAQVVIERLR